MGWLPPAVMILLIFRPTLTSFAGTELLFSRGWAPKRTRLHIRVICVGRAEISGRVVNEGDAGTSC